MTSDVIATGRKHRYRFATGGKLNLFEHILLSSILVNNRVIVIENRQQIFRLQLQLQLSTFENFQLQLPLQQNRVINYTFVNCSYNFSKPGANVDYRTYKNADEKVCTFSRRSKNVQKRTTKGYCVNPPK